jgi:UDP-N-acetylmuramoyl-L-alanyl-D-glutamate--2,6-diaminopimelate ligase
VLPLEPTDFAQYASVIAMARNLEELTDGLSPFGIEGAAAGQVTAICSDSRQVTPGCLFACIRGARVDGRDFAADAVRRGAGSILTDRRLDIPSGASQVIVEDVRKALALVSSRFYGDPSKMLKIVGITGTNGKTTTAHFVRSIVQAAGRKAGVMGTLGHYVGDSYEKDAFTTPEAPEVHRRLRSMVDAGVEYCAMEVSSHALVLHRALYVDFDVVCFTNLSRDHLDFHGGFEQYKKAKMTLFGIGDGRDFGPNRTAVVNTGDETGREIERLSPLPRLTYCLGRDADVRGDVLSVERQGSRLKVTHEQGSTMVKTRMQGGMNVENALAAYAIGLALGIDEDAILRGIAGLEQLPGRLEMLSGGGRSVVVDYAHTPDALGRLLADLREITGNRLICVFGCGGDRDRGKRPQMGRIAADVCDLVIVTSDNPRTEDPSRIIDDIVAGIPDGATYEVEPDRKRAIEKALAASAEGDVIAVAGKGHEDYQILGTRKVHFDDREIVRKLLGDIANAEPQHK